MLSLDDIKALKHNLKDGHRQIEFNISLRDLININKLIEDDLKRQDRLDECPPIIDVCRNYINPCG